jgi:hypothetical protein
MLQDEMAKSVVSARVFHSMNQGKRERIRRDWFELRKLKLSSFGDVAGACKQGMDSLHRATVSKSF